MAARGAPMSQFLPFFLCSLGFKKFSFFTLVLKVFKKVFLLWSEDEEEEGEEWCIMVHVARCEVIITRRV